jgi:type I site-specific restriction endonuclease
MQHMPPLEEKGLWPAQGKAIKNLEKSLADNRPRSLIQMATGSGKTFTAISFVYRLIKFAGARRVLFLVDRGNLGDQTLKEFQQYASPYNNFKFTEEYIVQRLTSNTLDLTARVCICTIQRMYSMLKGQPELAEDLEEESGDKLASLFKKPEPLEYNPKIPIESFDIIVTDECHRSIYNLWAQVLVLRRVLDRSHGRAEQADVRLFQPEPRDGIQPRSSVRNRSSHCSSRRWRRSAVRRSALREWSSRSAPFTSTRRPIDPCAAR